MKVIEAMKRLKHLNEKAADLRLKVAQNCAILDIETSAYPEPRKQITEWMQSHFDTVQEIARLRVAIQRTNLATSVSIELGGKAVTKTIAEWIHRRRDLAALDLDLWSRLGDRNLKEGQIASSVPGGLPKDVKIVRHFDARERDEKVALFKSEPLLIDAQLEVTNAVTDLLE